MAKVLVMEDDQNMLFVLDECLKRNHCETILTADAEECLEAFDEHIPDMVLLDFKVPKGNGLDVMEKIHQRKPEAIVIILTGHATINMAVDAMKKGAFEFITKPFDAEELIMVVKRALARLHVEKEIAAAQKLAFSSGNFFFASSSPKMAKIHLDISKIASTDYTVLIEGESGTGKSMIAREIHERSHRRKGPFVTIDCGALPENLIESELFGYEKGAFTGASSRRVGKIERANGGTLFIDEVSSLDFHSQAAFLNLLQNKEFERIGGGGPQMADVRIIVASNRDLKQLVDEKTFRHDLYYRLKIITILMPPLREHTEDIVPLTYFLLRKYAPEREIQLSVNAISKLMRFEWPGNIRELENAVKHALILLGDGDVIDAKHLPLEMDQGYWSVRKQNLSLKQMLDNTEKRIIQQTLLENNFDIEKCMKSLKISRRTWYYKVKRYGIDLK